MKTYDFVKIASKIIRDGRLDLDRYTASWHHLTLMIVSDHVGYYLALSYPLSRIPGRLAGVEATWSSVRRFDQRWDATPIRSSVCVCGNLRQPKNRGMNNRMVADLIRRMG